MARISRELSKARNRYIHKTRETINAPYYVKQLQRFVDGEITLTPAQISVAMFLIDKVIPKASPVAPDAETGDEKPIATLRGITIVPIVAALPATLENDEREIDDAIGDFDAITVDKDGAVLIDLDGARSRR